MVEKKAKLMSAREERAHNKKNVTKVDPDDDDTNVHRLVQDENAKTILLNFPLEVSLLASASAGTENCASNNLGSFPGHGYGKPPKKPSPRPIEDKRTAIKPELTKRSKLTG